MSEMGIEPWNKDEQRRAMDELERTALEFWRDLGDADVNVLASDYLDKFGPERPQTDDAT